MADDIVTRLRSGEGPEVCWGCTEYGCSTTSNPWKGSGLVAAEDCVCDCHRWPSWVRDAADEIERLRQENAEYERICRKWETPDGYQIGELERIALANANSNLRSEVEKLKAENTRLALDLMVTISGKSEIYKNDDTFKISKQQSYISVHEHKLEHTNQAVINVHDPSLCVGTPCTIHNMTDHHMRSWPQFWRSDRGLMERICPHGVGHPDPDEINPDTIHGCDGCCHV